MGGVVAGGGVLLNGGIKPRTKIIGETPPLRTRHTHTPPTPLPHRHIAAPNERPPSPTDGTYLS
jgi:hypothetical protein